MNIISPNNNSLYVKGYNNPPNNNDIYLNGYGILYIVFHKVIRG